MISLASRLVVVILCSLSPEDGITDRSPSIYMSFWDVNSDPYVCMASNSITDLYPQPPPTPFLRQFHVAQGGLNLFCSQR